MGTSPMSPEGDDVDSREVKTVDPREAALQNVMQEHGQIEAYGKGGTSTKSTTTCTASTSGVLKCSDLAVGREVRENPKPRIHQSTTGPSGRVMRPPPATIAIGDGGSGWDGRIESLPDLPRQVDDSQSQPLRLRRHAAQDRRDHPLGRRRGVSRGLPSTRTGTSRPRRAAFRGTRHLPLSVDEL